MTQGTGLKMYNWMHRRANISKSQTQATLKDDETERGSATLRLDVKSLGNVGKQDSQYDQLHRKCVDRSKPRSQRQVNETRGSSNAIIHILEGLREI